MEKPASVGILCLQVSALCFIILTVMSIENASSTREYKAAVSSLRRIFLNDPSPNQRPVEEILVANGRDLAKVQLNRSWLKDTLRPAHVYGLAEAVRNKKNTIVAVQITTKGKQVLDDITPVAAEEVASSLSNAPTLDTIVRDAKRVEELDPTVTIEVIIHRKGGASRA